MLQLYAAASFSNPMDFDQCSRVGFSNSLINSWLADHIPGSSRLLRFPLLQELEITAIPPAGAPHSQHVPVTRPPSATEPLITYSLTTPAFSWPTTKTAWLQ